MPVNRARIQDRAEKLARQGKTAAAIAEYRILLNDQPNDITTLNRMGDLLLRAGKNDEANSLFDRVAHLYTVGGFFHKAIAIYRKILKIDPDVVEPRLRLADLYARRDLTTEARTEYLGVVERLVRLGQHGRAREVHEKLVRMEPANVEARLALAEIQAKEGNELRSTQELRIAARGMESVNLAQEAVALHRRILKAPGAELEAKADSIRALVRLGEVEEALREARSLRAASPQEPASGECLVEVLDAAGLGDEAEALVAEGGGGDGPASRLVRGRAETRSGRKTEGIAEMLEAARIFASASRTDAAKVALEQVLEIDPVNAQARRLQHDLTDAAVPVGDHAPPAEPEASEIGGAMNDPVVHDVLDAELVKTGADLGPEGLGRPLTREEKDFLSEHLTEAEVFVKYGLYEKAIEPLQLVLSRFPTHVEAHSRLKGIYADQGNRGRVVHHCLAIADLHEKAGRREEAIKVLTEAMNLDPDNQNIRTRLEHLQGAPPRRVARSFVEPRPPGRGADMEISVQEEAEGGARGGDGPEAGAVAGDTAAMPTGRDGENRPCGGEGLLDLTGEFASTLAEVLGDEGAEAPASQETREFGDVLKEFREKIAAEVDTADFATHYQLGIAYKEMGLLDEAVAELEHAAGDPTRLIECAAMLGLCLRQKGMPVDAEAWYVRGLASGLGTAEQQLGLRFDLAETYIEMGDIVRARQTFGEVAKVDRNYRDVRARIEEVERMG